MAFLGLHDNSVEDLLSNSLDANSSSFELSGGLILVEGSVEGEKGNFILDTGASDLVINKPAERREAVAGGLGGEIAAEEILISNFKVGAFEANEVNAFKTDLSSFEKGATIDIAGLIGHSLFNEQALEINYKDQIFKLDSSPKKKDMIEDGWQVYSLVEFGHLLAVKMKIDGKAYWMGLDTGAEVNILSDQFSEDLIPNKNQCKQICGIGKKTISLPQISAPIAKIGDLAFHTTDFYLSPFKEVQDQIGNGLDGLLGFPFFNQFEVVLDYASNRLYLK